MRRARAAVVALVLAVVGCGSTAGPDVGPPNPPAGRHSCDLLAVFDAAATATLPGCIEDPDGP